MYERSYGYRYDETRDATNVEIARKIRADIKTAVAEGLLPDRWTYSVRVDHGTSIDVEVKDCADAWTACDGRDCHNVWCKAKGLPEYAHAATEHDRLSDEAAAAKMTLQRIHGAYNHDGSEIQVDYFDVRYYGLVHFEDPSSADFRQREKERLEARKQARESGTVVGKVANFAGRGRPVVHFLVEQADGKKVLGCGAVIRKSSLFSKVNDDSTVSCSRCAKKHGRGEEDGS